MQKKIIIVQKVLTKVQIYDIIGTRGKIRGKVKIMNEY